jgi:hypothetical protein
MRALWLILVLCLGCEEKSDCEKACEATKECPRAPPYFDNIECDEGCEYQEGVSHDYGCGAQWNTFVACGAANLDRACDPNTCSAEAMAWSGCFPD